MSNILCCILLMLRHIKIVKFTIPNYMLIADIPWFSVKKILMRVLYFEMDKFKLFHISSKTIFFRMKFVRNLYKMPKWLWYLIRYPNFFSIIKALEKEGGDHYYSLFSKNKKYAEMMCKLFEKKCTGIEIKENALQHLQFALTWPSMAYVLTVHRMLYFFFTIFYVLFSLFKM